MVTAQPGHVCLICTGNNFALAYDWQFCLINFMVKLSIINVFKCGLNGMIIL